MVFGPCEFLGDAEASFESRWNKGLIWPNNRDVDDLVPHLDRLAGKVLWLVRAFRDGRGLRSGAAVAGTSWIPRRIARATGQGVLRDSRCPDARGFDTLK